MRLGDNLANHMAYIYCMILFDKFDISFKRICNFYGKVIEKRKLWQSDEISSDELVEYCKKKNIDVVGWVKSIPQSHKLTMADIKGKNGVLGAYVYIEGALASTMYLVIPVLKENYRFSNDKINAFMDYTAKYIKGYYLGNCNDEMIRQTFIEEAHYDILLGEKV